MNKYIINMKYGYLLFIIVLISAVLRLYNLGETSLWKDEIFSLIRSSQPLSLIIFERLPFGTWSPLHHIFIHFALFFGKGEFIIRLPSVLFGIASIALIYGLGKSVFKDHKVGLIAAMLLALSPLHLEYSREARYYSFTVFFSLLSILFCYKIISETKWRWVILFSLVTILNVVTHATALLILIPQLLFLVIHGLKVLRDKLKKSSFKIKLKKLQLKHNFTFRTVFIIPLLVTVFIVIKSSKQLLYSIKINPALPFSEFLTYISEKLSGSTPLAIFYLTFLTLGLVITFRKKKDEFLLLFPLLIIPPLILYFIRPEGFDFHIRYVIFTVIPFILITSYSIANIINNRNLTFIVISSFVLLSIQPIQAYYQIKKGDWRGVGRYLTQNAESGDIVITENYYNKILLDYYLQAQKHGYIIKTSAERLIPLKVPFRVYFFQTDYALKTEPNPEGLSLIDYKKIIPFDPRANMSSMYLFVSRRIWVWQEGGRDFLDNIGWKISDYWGQKAIGNNALEVPNATISYKIHISENGSYNLYANLRWDGARGLLKYKFDNENYSLGFQPFYGIKGDVSTKWRFKEVKLGSDYLEKGEHKLTFLNEKLPDEDFHYQDIDYFYLTKNEKL